MIGDLKLEEGVLTQEDVENYLWHQDPAFGVAYKVLEWMGDQFRLQTDTQLVRGGWRMWDGKRWARDAEGVMYRRILDVICEMYSEIATIKADQYERGRRARLLIKLDRRDGTDRVFQYLNHYTPLIKAAEEFDQDRGLVNYLNGTLDRRTGLLRTHVSGDYLTKLKQMEYLSGVNERELYRRYREKLAEEDDGT